MRGVGPLRDLDDIALAHLISRGAAEAFGGIVVPKLRGGSPLHDRSPGPPELFSGAHVNNSGTVSIPNGGVNWTSVTFDTNDFDTDAYHSTTSNTSRLTAPKTGYYGFGGSFSYASNSTGARFIRLIVNGTTLLDSLAVPALNGFETPLAVSGEYRLALGDYVELQAYQSSGGALNVSVTNYKPLFWIKYLAS